MARKSLDKWIDEAMSDPDKKRITRLTLVHMVGMQYQEIHTFRFSEKGGDDAKKLATMFRGKAESYAQDLPGVQTFVMWAYYGAEEPEARQPFMVNVQADPGTMGLSTEPPTETGDKMQRMRQGEMMFQQVYRRQQTMDDFSIRMIDMQGKMIDRLMHESMDNMRIATEMMVRSQLDNHTQKMEAMRYERSTEERKKWLQFAPVLVNTLLGKEVFPQSTEDTALIEGIAESVDEQLLGKLMGVGIPDALMGPLAARVAKAMEKKRVEAEKVKQLPVYRGKPEDDITGGQGDPH
jgi:hypothetical protein